MDSIHGERNGTIDFLKIIATIIILLHHFQQLFGVSYGPIKFFGGKFYFGSMVELFFMISGYLTYKWTDRITNRSGNVSFRSFMNRKYVRLLPMMALGATVYEFLIFIYRHIYFSLFLGSEDINASGVVLELLGIQRGWVTQEALVVNNPTWYVSVLLLCYIVFYLVTVVAWRLQVKPIYFYIFVSLAGLGILNYGINAPFMNISSGRGYFNFFLGILLAEYVNKHGVSIKLTIISAGVILFTILLIIYQIKNYNEYKDSTWLSLAFFPSMILILQNRVSKHIFDHKLIFILSDATYDTYIWHLNIILCMLCIQGIRTTINLSNVMTEVIYIIVAFSVGIVFVTYIERPLTQKMGRIVHNL